MKETIILIVVITLCFSFALNSIFFGWEATRRSADDVVKINYSERDPYEEFSEEIQSCIDGGGLPNYYQGKFQDCKKNK